MSTQDPISVIVALRNNLNDLGLDGAMVLFADDAVLRLVPPPPPPDRGVYQGSDEIRRWLRALLAEQLHVEFEHLQVAGDEVAGHARISADRYRRLGLDPAEADIRATVREGMIRSLNIDFAPSSTERMHAVAVARPEA